MTEQLTTSHLDVPGARLYYEVRGAGPLLLVIGQPMTSGPFGPLADLLAADHTVLTYDPRGLGRSTVADPSLDVTPEVEADDLARIVATVGGAPADVFGSSGGAVTGLALAARHADTVRTLVAHEPPLTELLPDAAQVLAVVDRIEHAFRTGGPGAAWGTFVGLVMHDGPVTSDGVPAVSRPPQEQGDGAAQDDDEMFFLHMLKPFTRYLPQVDVLKAGPPRVVVAVGEASGQQVARRSADALAATLGTPPATFPGDHGGFMSDPARFAEAIRRVLDGREPS
jgi:pimeloyl-ACP methyl ester carboxylesterase